MQIAENIDDRFGNIVAYTNYVRKNHTRFQLLYGDESVFFTSFFLGQAIENS